MEFDLPKKYKSLENWSKNLLIQVEIFNSMSREKRHKNFLVNPLLKFSDRIRTCMGEGRYDCKYPPSFEKLISYNPSLCCDYIRYGLVPHDLKKLETTIAESGFFSILLAYHRNARFPEGEPAITKINHLKLNYLDFLKDLENE